MNRRLIDKKKELQRKQRESRSQKLKVKLKTQNKTSFRENLQAKEQAKQQEATPKQDIAQSQEADSQSQKSILKEDISKGDQTSFAPDKSVPQVPQQKASRIESKNPAQQNEQIEAKNLEEQQETETETETETEAEAETDDDSPKKRRERRRRRRRRRQQSDTNDQDDSHKKEQEEAEKKAQIEKKKKLFESAINKLRAAEEKDENLYSLVETMDEYTSKAENNEGNQLETTTSQDEIIAEATQQEAVETVKPKLSAKDRFRRALGRLGIQPKESESTIPDKPHLEASSFKERLKQRQTVEKMIREYLEGIGLKYSSTDFKRLSNKFVDMMMLNMEISLPKYRKAIEKLIERKELPIRSGAKDEKIKLKKSDAGAIIGTIFPRDPSKRGTISTFTMPNISDFSLSDDEAETIREALLSDLLSDPFYEINQERRDFIKEQKLYNQKTAEKNMISHQEARKQEALQKQPKQPTIETPKAQENFEKIQKKQDNPVKAQEALTQKPNILPKKPNIPDLLSGDKLKQIIQEDKRSDQSFPLDKLSQLLLNVNLSQESLQLKDLKDRLRNKLRKN